MISFILGRLRSLVYKLFADRQRFPMYVVHGTAQVCKLEKDANMEFQYFLS
jgi:hypothetical protein